ncbi:cytochrome P450 [Archangium violaceum]|uniref:cytochrome P450 n=1 Tax=Archangium violaceum TaxID=83451 RepID=UPI002B2E0DA3|nr:cytochrome P450 [Archangium gephyra]
MKAKHPPGPKGNALLGNILAAAKGELDFFRELGSYGDVSSFHLGRKRFYFVNHPELIRKVLTSQNFVRTAISRELMASFLGRGLFSQEGENHLQQRRLMQPAFHHKRIEGYGAVMERYATRMLEGWKDGETRDIAHDMMRLTFEIVSKTLFDADTGEQASQVSEAFTGIMQAVNKEYPVYTVLPEWVPVKRWGASRRAVDALNRITNSIIQERRATGEDRGDLLSMLLLARDEDGTKMTDEQVGAQTLSLLFAGHETTANLLSWTWLLLSRNPDIRQKLQEEVDAVLEGRAPTVGDLRQLKYTESVVKETLRIYPPAWYAERAPLTDTELGGYTIPANAPIVISVYVTHRDGRFFEQPERFWPERFLGVEDRQLPAYLPFGGGSHLCIGNRFALMEAQLLVAAIAQRYELELEPGLNVKPRPLITLGVEGLRMKVKRRQTGAESPRANPASTASDSSARAEGTKR